MMFLMLALVLIFYYVNQKCSCIGSTEGFAAADPDRVTELTDSCINNKKCNKKKSKDKKKCKNACASNAQQQAQQEADDAAAEAEAAAEAAEAAEVDRINNIIANNRQQHRFILTVDNEAGTVNLTRINLNDKVLKSWDGLIEERSDKHVYKMPVRIVNRATLKAHMKILELNRPDLTDEPFMFTMRGTYNAGSGIGTKYNPRIATDSTFIKCKMDPATKIDEFSVFPCKYDERNFNEAINQTFYLTETTDEGAKIYKTFQ